MADGPRHTKTDRRKKDAIEAHCTRLCALIPDINGFTGRVPARQSRAAGEGLLSRTSDYGNLRPLGDRRRLAEHLFRQSLPRSSALWPKFVPRRPNRWCRQYRGFGLTTPASEPRRGGQAGGAARGGAAGERAADSGAAGSDPGDADAHGGAVHAPRHGARAQLVSRRSRPVRSGAGEAGGIAGAAAAERGKGRGGEAGAVLDAGDGRGGGAGGGSGAWKAESFRVRGAAVAGKAMEESRAAAGIESRTEHGLEYGCLAAGAFAGLLCDMAAGGYPAFKYGNSSPTVLAQAHGA